MFQCQECGKLFKSVSAARKASNDGCPKCGGCDVDVYVPKSAALAARPAFDLRPPMAMQADGTIRIG